jgi:hypothetical protein
MSCRVVFLFCVVSRLYTVVCHIVPIFQKIDTVRLKYGSKIMSYRTVSDNRVVSLSDRIVRTILNYDRHKFKTLMRILYSKVSGMQRRHKAEIKMKNR